MPLLIEQVTLKRAMKIMIIRAWLSIRWKSIISRRRRPSFPLETARILTLSINMGSVWWLTRTSCLHWRLSSVSYHWSCFPQWSTTTHSKECQSLPRSLNSLSVTLDTQLPSARSVLTHSCPFQWNAPMASLPPLETSAWFMLTRQGKIFATLKCLPLRHALLKVELTPTS